ncbi:MAG: alpha/beta hydrolase-fold protein [Anaerolineales bacterium]|nr:alpha/beta hydrolase-fold protein [Anaerolineales bacterium]MCX7609848.1 alpha/beta hydrolase-fold protein [Anaerolineales bacterium]MDW8227319.1 alpha/beta hydrolase-fold protein [Anaerolineales bacterium]
MSTLPLLALARTLGNPVIQDDTATFLWQGPTPVFLIEDLHNWEADPQPMTRAAPDVWQVSLKLPRDAYLEYAFLDPQTGQRVQDPLNPNKVWNGVSDWNHYFYMPEARPTDLVRPARRLPRGRVTRFQIETGGYACGRKRTVYLYQPPVKKPVPLLLVYDGVDYLRRASLNVILDNLIAARRVRPFAMALVDHGGPARRLEYSCSDATLAFIFEHIIPLAQENLPLTAPGVEPYAVLGASMGGLMALYTALRLPKVFGKALLQSGAFFVPELHSVVEDLIAYLPPPELEIWMDVGKFEWLLEGNRRMYNLLKERRYRVTYREYSGGHNFTSWRNDLPHGLEKCLA